MNTVDISPTYFNVEHYTHRIMRSGVCRWQCSDLTLGVGSPKTQ